MNLDRPVGLELRTRCTLCEKKALDHHGPELFCTTLGVNKFTVERIMPRDVAMHLMAGMLCGAYLMGTGERHAKVQDFDQQADEAINSAMVGYVWKVHY